MDAGSEASRLSIHKTAHVPPPLDWLSRGFLSVFAVLLATTTCLSGCTAADGTGPDETVLINVSVSPAVASMQTGQTLQLTAIVTGTTNQTVTWTSATAGVANVSSGGLVTCVGLGTAVIIATSVADPTKSASATITVAEPIKVSLAPSGDTILVGETVQLIATVSGAGNTAVTWSSSAPAVAGVSGGGLVTGVAAGTAVVTAASVADPVKSGSATITVLNPCATFVGSATTGQTVTGTLSASDCVLSDGSFADRWSFTLSSGLGLQIDLASAEFDAFLAILDAQGGNVAFDDDGGPGDDARIVMTLSAGEYVLLATSDIPGTTGGYQLTVSADPCAGAVGTVSLDQPVSGSLAAGDCVLGTGAFADRWGFALVGATTVQIDLSGSGFDPFLIVQDVQGTSIVSDDDRGPGNDARILATLPAGEYVIVATNTAAAATGAYQLSVRTGTPCTTDAGTIADGQRVSGSLVTGDCVLGNGTLADRWVMALATATYVQVDLKSADFDPFLRIRDPLGRLIALNGDGGTGTDARVVTTLPAGEYVIWASSEHVGATGAYQLSVNVDPCAEVVGSMGVGQTVSGALAVDDCMLPSGSFTDRWAFALAAETSLQIDLSSGSFDPFLTVQDTQGRDVVSDDDHGPGDDARVLATLPAGSYVILATSALPGATGGYQLSARTGTPCTTTTGSIGLGQTVSGSLAGGDCVFGDGAFADRWAFTLGADTEVRLDLTTVDFSPFLLVTDQLGNAEALDFGSGTDARIEADLSAGVYFVWVSSMSPGEAGQYQLSAQHGDPCAAVVGTVAVGQTVNGALEATDCERSTGKYADRWAFTLGAETDVQVDLKSRDFDAYLLITTAQGTTVTSNDDGGPDRSYDSRVVTRLAAGDYVIWATTFDAGETGSYDLSVETGTPCTTNVGSIAVGQTVSGSLGTGDCELGFRVGWPLATYDLRYGERWSFTLSATMTAQIDLTSSGFDAWLRVTDLENNLMEDDNDGGTGTNAQIVEALPAGEYLIWAMSRHRGRGSYQLSVR